MGDCDRMKKYISDYLENNLDPTTREQFEKNLKLHPELSSITKNISTLPYLLHNLAVYKCSDDFILNLRQKIHSGTETTVAKGNIWKFSLAISFLIVIIVTIFGLNSIFLQRDTTDSLHDSQDYQIIDSKPVQMPIKNSDNNPYLNSKASIKSEDTQTTLTDSSKIPSDAIKDNRVKQVKQINTTPIKNKN